MSVSRFALVMAVVIGGGLTAPAQAAAPEDPRALLAEGEALLAGHDPQAAFFVLERAAFLAPEDAAIRRALAQALARLGAADTARNLLREAGAGDATQRRMELALGYSSNRSQEPALQSLTLTLPGLPAASYPLTTPYRPRPGTMLWLGLAMRQATGDSLQLRLTAAPDTTLGQFWLVGQKALPWADWFVRGEYQQRLGDGRQGALLLRREWSLKAGLTGNAEAGVRSESGQRYGEWRAGLAQTSPWGDWYAGLQISDPLETVVGGRQTRSQLGWGHAIVAGPGQLTLGLAWRASIDAEAYHPWIAGGARRWQQAWVGQAGWEMPLDARRNLFVQINGENNRSNIALFSYRRAEVWFGLLQAW